MPDYVTKTITGVPVFGIGYADNGRDVAREFTRDHLDMIIRNFGTDRAPANGVGMKVGHTSDAFNSILAREMGVPAPLLTGEVVEGRVRGAARLGLASKVYLDNADNPTQVLGDFDNVPEPLADAITSGLYNDISPELQMLYNSQGELVDIILHNVSVLGTDEPSMDGLPADSLAVAEVFAHFSVNGLKESTSPADNTDPDADKPAPTDDSLISRAVRFFHRKPVDNPSSNDDNNSNGGTDMEIEKLRAVLGLADDADEDAVTAAINEMRAKVAADQDDATNQGDNDDTPAASTPTDQASTPDISAQIAESEVVAAMSKRIEQLETDKSNLEQAQLVSKYTAMAATWNAVPGKPDELGEQLAKLHREAGEEVVKGIVEQYTVLNSRSQASTHAFGSGRTMETTAQDDPWELKVQEYAKEHDVAYGKALVHMMSADNPGYVEYRRRQRAD